MKNLIYLFVATGFLSFCACNGPTEKKETNNQDTINTEGAPIPKPACTTSPFNTPLGDLSSYHLDFSNLPSNHIIMVDDASNSCIKKIDLDTIHTSNHTLGIKVISGSGHNVLEFLNSWTSGMANYDSVDIAYYPKLSHDCGKVKNCNNIFNLVKTKYHGDTSATYKFIGTDNHRNNAIANNWHFVKDISTNPVYIRVVAGSPEYLRVYYRDRAYASYSVCLDSIEQCKACL